MMRSKRVFVCTLQNTFIIILQIVFAVLFGSNLMETNMYGLERFKVVLGGLL